MFTWPSYGMSFVTGQNFLNEEQHVFLELKKGAHFLSTFTVNPQYELRFGLFGQNRDFVTEASGIAPMRSK